MAKHPNKGYGQQSCPTSDVTMSEVCTASGSHTSGAPGCRSLSTDVVDKLRHRKQVSKLIYDRTAKDLPELAVGDAVRMKPLPGDRTGIWRRGVYLRKVAPQSYLVEVKGSFLRLAEPLPSQNQAFTRMWWAAATVRCDGEQEGMLAFSSTYSQQAAQQSASLWPNTDFGHIGCHSLASLPSTLSIWPP